MSHEPLMKSGENSKRSEQGLTCSSLLQCMQQASREAGAALGRAEKQLR